MKQLIHNGVLIPEYEWKRLHLSIKDVDLELNLEQEKMALAWVKKLGTRYLKDKVFVKNFFRDFCKAMDLKEKLSLEDFDFSAIEGYINRDRAMRLNLTKEAKKNLRDQHKTQKEANRQRHGFALVDGVKTEISNYTAEPSCIFMGRGKHPLRGRWKEGPREEDIELNLSSDATMPPGNWKAVLWLPDVMWIARWRDKLTGNMRYVWLSENSALKQKKEIDKFDKAQELRRDLARIQSHIFENLDATDLKRKKTATVCYLVDKLKIRVGDEKDLDEADTVGASTLRPGHIKLEENGEVTFDFLGKDSVPHIFKVELPEKVVRNLKEFSANAESTLFNGVDSERVSEFLGEVLSGLSAKVFRTCYASEAVENRLESTPVKIEAPDYVKKHVATMANLEAARICNHRRTIPKSWRSSLRNKETRLRQVIGKSKEAQGKVRLGSKDREERLRERLKKQNERLEAMKQKLETYGKQMTESKQKGKPIVALTRRTRLTRRAITRQKEQIKKLRYRSEDQGKKLEERLVKRRQRDEGIIEKMRLQIEAKKETRDYNLGTSLKSYIDPRIYYSWGKDVGYDWKLYYPKTLQKKFSWVETGASEST